MGNLSNEATVATDGKPVSNEVGGGTFSLFSEKSCHEYPPFAYLWLTDCSGELVCLPVATQPLVG